MMEKGSAFPVHPLHKAIRLNLRSRIVGSRPAPE